MENFKEKGRLSRRFSSRKSLGSLKTRFKKFLSDHHTKAGEAEGVSSTTNSDSDTDGKKTSSPPPDRSGEIKKSSGSGSSSDSDEGSPSELKKQKKSDSSSDSSSEKKKKKRPSKSSRKKMQLHLQQERQEPFRLPALEETPPTSPQSNPRFSTGAQSDYGRLWTHASAPNSPANLAHNLNISYRGGDSSPVALVHSLSARERGKHPSQLSEISYASPPSSSSLDLDVLGVKLEDMTASPSKTTPSLKPNGLPIVHHDEEQGVWRCGSCGWIYPNPNPSLRNRREHKKHCGEITNVQRWLGSQDIQDAPGKGAVELEDSGVWEGSGLQEKLSTADEHPMGKFDREDNHEGVSDRSTDYHRSVGHGRLDEMESNGSPDHRTIGDEGNGGRSPSPVADPYEVPPHHHADGDEGSGGRRPSTFPDPHEGEDQKLNRVLEWPTFDGETKDQSSSDEILPNSSTKHHEVEDHIKLEHGSYGSTAHHGIEEVSKLDDSVDLASVITPEGESQKEESVEVKADQEEVTHSVESRHMFGSDVETHGSQLNQKPQEETRNEAGDVQVQPVNGNGKHSFAVVHSNEHDLVHFDNTVGLKGEDENANQDFNDHLKHPEETGLAEVPEVHSEQSVLTSDSGGEGGQHMDDLRNKDDLDSQSPGDDGFSREALAVKAIEKTEPVITHKGRPIVMAEVVHESEVTEPSLSSADLQSVETAIEKRDVKALKAVACEVTNVDKVIPKLTEPSHSQNSNLETKKDGKTNGIEISERSSQQKVTESDSVEGNSTRVSPSQENGIRTENVGRVAGSPSPLEEVPKWVNSVMITSQDEGDTFTSVQKYWADVTRSEYLLVEGKRSPSFGRCDDIGFPSFRNGEGRRSPSPFSLGKSEDGEVQNSPSVASSGYRSNVEDKNEERAIPSGAVVLHDGSSSSSAHVDYDFEKVVHEQNTHDLVCPVCGSDVTERIILKKRKRTRVHEDGRVAKAILTQRGVRDQDRRPQVDESDDETWGCLACLSFFTRRRRGEGRLSQALVPGAEEEQTPLVSGESVETEKESIRCLPALLRWGRETSEPELQVPLLGEAAKEDVVGEVSEPRPVNIGRVQEVPLDDDEEVSCFSYLQRSKSSDTTKEEDIAEIAKPIPVSTGHVREVPLDEDEPVSCFSYLQRSKQEPRVKEEATEESSIPNLQAELEDEAPNVSEQVVGVGAHGDESPDKDQESVIQLLDGIGLSQPREAVEKEKCECFPFFSFRSETSFSVKTVTDTSSSTRDFHPVEDLNKEGTSESLPASVPAFPWGTSSKYDLPPSPGMLSSHQEITSVIDRPDEARTQGSQALEDTEGKRSCNCLPELLPAFSWRSIPVYTHPPLGTDESAGTEQHEETTAGSPTALLTQQPQAMEDAEEKRSCNCLPELLPAFSLGPIPVYTHPPLDTDESAELEQHEEITAGSPSASVTQEPQALGDAEEKGTCNCLPELVPAFSWGPIPGFTHPPPDTYEFAGKEQHEEATAGSLSASVTQEPRDLGNAEEKGTCNCLPELLPAFSWGPTPLFTHPPPDTYEFAGHEQHEEATSGNPSASGTQETRALQELGEKGSCNCLPELLPTFSWRSIPVNDTEIQSSPQATTEHIHEVPIDDDEDSKSSRLETESKESATCACLPLLLPAFKWGFTRTTYGNGLREPLLPQDPHAAGPVLLDNSSTDPMQTTGIPEPVLLQGLEEGLAVEPARPVTVAGPPSSTDLVKGTQITESEDFHIEGIVSSRKTVTKAEPSGEPAEVINSVNVQESNYLFAVDIKDGHFGSTVEKLQPKPPLFKISNGDADSPTHYSDLSAETSDEPEYDPAESSQVVEGDLDDFKHLAQAIAGHLAEEDTVASPVAVSQPVETILRQTFPAEEIEETIEDKLKHEHGSCNCLSLSLPTVRWWRPSIDNMVGEGLEKHLLDNVEENQDARNILDMSLATKDTHVELQRGQPSVDGTGERCHCLPSLPKFSLYDVFRDHHVSAEPPLPGTEVDDIRTPLLGRTPHKPDIVVEINRTETSIAVEGATTAEAAAEAIAIAQGQSPSRGERTPPEYLKSIVHGGRDVTLVSLGVVASGAGGDAKTKPAIFAWRASWQDVEFTKLIYAFSHLVILSGYLCAVTVVAIGLANLAFGLIRHFNTIMSLYYNNRTQFQEEVGEGFIHGCLSLISFLFFGALAPITYGFSFRNATSKNYKFAATCVVALLSLVLLGAASARVKSKSPVRVISTLIVTGFLASIAGYGTGNIVAQLLELSGFSSV